MQNRAVEIRRRAERDAVDRQTAIIRVVIVLYVNVAVIQRLRTQAVCEFRQRLEAVAMTARRFVGNQ